MELKAKEVSQLLKLISNPYRLMILCILEEGEKTVSELHEQLTSITMPALSQHLSALRLAGLIVNEKHGLHVYYKLQDDRILKVMKTLKEVYCE